jgi:predicted component of type VI protein secretion system
MSGDYAPIKQANTDNEGNLIPIQIVVNQIQSANMIREADYYTDYSEENNENEG